MKRCPNCGAEIADAIGCPLCGALVEDCVAPDVDDVNPYASGSQTTRAGEWGEPPEIPSGFWRAVYLCFRKTFSIKGRASRSEFWYFWLARFIGAFGFAFAFFAREIFERRGGSFVFLLLVPVAIGAFLAFPIGGALVLVAAIVWTSDDPDSIWGFLLAYAALLAIVVGTISNYCVSVRRFRDLGRRGAWVLPFAAIPWIALVCALRDDQIFFGSNPLAWSAGFVLLGCGFLIWASRPGQSGPNKYGPAPERRESAKSLKQ